MTRVMKLAPSTVAASVQPKRSASLWPRIRPALLACAHVFTVFQVFEIGHARVGSALKSHMIPPRVIYMDDDHLAAGFADDRHFAIARVPRAEPRATE
ncbi:MAG TPA: hypothetical protein VIK01_20690 [Polyangiaceae bacterium]